MKRSRQTTWLQFYNKALRPVSVTEDARRREFILNIILFGLAIISVIAVGTSVAQHIIRPEEGSTLVSQIVSVGFLAVVMAVWWLSRRGRFIVGAYVIIGLVWVAATQLVLDWSIALPAAELTYALVIVLSGVLVSSSAALGVTATTSLAVLLIGDLQVSHILMPTTNWLNQPVEISDAIGYALILWIIGLVSWLANREIDRSLQRARGSEAALARERDNLEVKVKERTRQLEQAQMERLLELQRFAEFGRLSSGLLHDLATPLTTVSLSLEQLGQHQRSQAVRRASQSLRQLERYVEAMRKQLKHEGVLKSFPVGAELRQAISMLSHKARLAGVTIEVHREGEYRLFGDPVKFSQLAANLIANAIEAYAKPPAGTAPRRVAVELTRQKDGVRLVVQDWGSGMTAAVRASIFEPFYSTKHIDGRNTGIGLSMVREIAEGDFGGRIEVTSSSRQGTRFVADLHAQPAPKRQTDAKPKA